MATNMYLRRMKMNQINFKAKSQQKLMRLVSSSTFLSLNADLKIQLF